MGDNFESSSANFFFGIFSFMLCIPCGYYGGSWSLENLTYVIADSVRDLPSIIYMIIFIHAFIPTIIITFLPLLIYNFAVRELTKKENDDAGIYQAEDITKKNIQKDNRTVRQKLSFIVPQKGFDYLQQRKKPEKSLLTKNSDHSKQSSHKPKWSEPGFAARTFKATDLSENDNALTDNYNEHSKAFISNSLNEKTNIELKSELRRLKKEWKKVSKEIDRKGGSSIQTNELLGVRNSLMDSIMEIEKNLNYRNKEKRWF